MAMTRAIVDRPQHTARDRRIHRLANDRFTERQLRDIAYRFAKLRRQHSLTYSQLASMLGYKCGETVRRIEESYVRPKVTTMARFYELELKFRHERQVTRQLTSHDADVNVYV